MIRTIVYIQLKIKNSSFFLAVLSGLGSESVLNLRIWSCSSYTGYLFKPYLLYITYCLLCI